MLKQEIHVVLDNVRSRENVGSIFRTADAAGVSKIYLCGITPTPNDDNPSTGSGFASRLAKTALGAEKWVPWEYRKQTWKCLLEIKNQNAKIKIIGFERTKKSVNIFKFKLPKNYSIVLVVGNEVKGLSPKILKYCDKKVAIPMYGRKESLNVAVAAGIAIYTVISKIKNKKSKSQIKNQKF